MVTDLVNNPIICALTLDLGELNYDEWQELFEAYCMCFGVNHHLEEATFGPKLKKLNSFGETLDTWHNQQIFPPKGYKDKSYRPLHVGESWRPFSGKKKNNILYW